IEASRNPSLYVTRARLAVDRGGTPHIAWWNASEHGGNHGYAVIREGKVFAEPLRFDKGPIHQDGFDLGIDPLRQLIIAYKATLPAEHRDWKKVHIRRRTEKGWTHPEPIGGEGEELFGDISVVWNDRRTLVSWVSRETIRQGGGVLGSSFRRLSVT